MTIAMRNHHLFFVYIISFFAAFSSLVYELQYSQLLSVLYGNSVLRYSVTIGLYLFSLGVGSMSFRLFQRTKNEYTLWASQLLLSIIGPLGVVGIIWLDNILFQHYQLRTQQIMLILAHIPIVVTGVLAGIQIPLLSNLGNLIKKRSDMFVEVLGVDYFGSLVGAVLYGLVLYPKVGLIKTAFLVGAINVSLSLLCAFVTSGNRRKVFIGVSVIALFCFAALNFKGALLEQKIVDMYMLVSVQKERAIVRAERDRITLEQSGGSPRALAYTPKEVITIDDHFTTPYQEVRKYTISVGKIADQCIQLARHTNMCDSWANAYHNALVHVPMSFVPKRDRPYQVLILGGGSLLPAKNALRYGAMVDQVDIDRQFVEYAQRDPYFAKYNNGIADASGFTIYYEDAFSFLRKNTKQYDLVVMSLPGFGDEKLIHLGSVEFFTFLQRALRDDGLMVTWEYGALDPSDLPQQAVVSKQKREHLRVLFKDISEGGFNSYFTYFSYLTIPGSNEKQNLIPSDTFYIFQKGVTPLVADTTRSPYMSYLRDVYQGLDWHTIDKREFSDIRPSRVFAPNYDIMTSI